MLNKEELDEFLLVCYPLIVTTTTNPVTQANLHKGMGVNKN
jgi:hypothetical protein